MAAAPAARRVVVIGAGASGMAAARDLRSAGAEVVVVEARDRTGGRIWTERLGDGTAVDMGAAWLHGHTEANPMTKIARDLQATLVVTDWQENSECWQAVGPAAGRPEPAREPMTDEDWKNANREFKRTEQLHLQEQARRKQDWPNGPDESLWEGLKKLKSKMFPGLDALDERTRNLVTVLWAEESEYDYAAGMEDLSFTWWNADGCVDGENCLWKDGYRALIDHLAEGVDVRLSCPVRAVREVPPDEDGNGVEVCLASGEALRCSACVCTLPLGILRAGHVEFEPPLEPEKVAAAQRMKMGLLNKIVLRFDTCFWPAETHVLARAPVVDARRQPEALEVPMWVNMKCVTGATALVGLLVASTADLAENRTDEELTAHALDLLRSMFPEEVVDGAKLLEAKVTRWRADEFTLGSYSYLPPGSSPQDREALAKRHGAVFFAGEATELHYPSTVHGAYLSGKRAAKEALGHLGIVAPSRRTRAKGRKGPVANVA